MLKLILYLTVVISTSTLIVVKAGHPTQEDPNWIPEEDSVAFIDELEKLQAPRPKRTRLRSHGSQQEALPRQPFTTTTAAPLLPRVKKSKGVQVEGPNEVTSKPEDGYRDSENEVEGTSADGGKGNPLLKYIPKRPEDSESNSDGIKLMLDPNVQERLENLRFYLREKRNEKAYKFAVNSPLYYANVEKIEREWLFTERPNNGITSPHNDYGPCTLGYDDCLPGEFCIDPEILREKICEIDACTTSAETACPTGGGGDTSENEQTGVNSGVTYNPACRGCRLPQECPKPPHDGICADKVKPPEDYAVNEPPETDPTPMVFFAGTLLLGDPCSAYGDAIDKVQRGSIPFDEKGKTLRTNQGSQRFGTEICNWAVAHLECIPDDPRMRTTTETPPSPSQIEAYKNPKGKCKCMLALGAYAVVERDPEKDIDICYIPANKGPHSECDQEITPPHGTIDGWAKKKGPVYKGPEPAAKYCTPNAECRTGYKYTGLRCMCKPKAKWDPKTFTCANAVRLRSGEIMVALLSVLMLLFKNYLTGQ